MFNDKTRASTVQTAKAGRIITYSELETSRGYIGRYLHRIALELVGKQHPSRPVPLIDADRNLDRAHHAADADLEHPARIVLVDDLALLQSGHEFSPAVYVFHIVPHPVDCDPDRNGLNGLDQEATAMIGSSPASLTRCNSRPHSRSKGTTRCIVPVLSHMSRSPGRQTCVYWKRGCSA